MIAFILHGGLGLSYENASINRSRQGNRLDFSPAVVPATLKIKVRLKTVVATVMSSLISHLGLDGLSVDERLRLVEEIWDSLEFEGGGPPLSDAQRNELDRRVAALDANPGSAVAWDEVEAQALARLRK